MTLTLYDFLMIGIVGLCAIQGAWKGMAWQIAPIASLVLGYMVAVPMTPSVAPMFGQPPWNQVLAMLTVYVVVALAVYLMVRSVRDSIEKLKLTEFDRHLGFIFGAVKGVLVTLAITIGLVSVSKDARHWILNTESGSVARTIVAKVDPILPPGIHAMLAPYLNNLSDGVPADPNQFAEVPQQQRRRPVRPTPPPRIAGDDNTWSSNGTRNSNRFENDPNNSDPFNNSRPDSNDPNFSDPPVNRPNRVPSPNRPRVPMPQDDFGNAPDDNFRPSNDRRRSSNGNEFDRDTPNARNSQPLDTADEFSDFVRKRVIVPAAKETVKELFNDPN